MSFIILDLDNTIADDEWRIPRIDWTEKDPFKRYHTYHSLSGFDEADNEELFVDPQHEIIILTARPVYYSSITMEWLKRKNIKPFALLMRNNDDHCTSVELKRKHISWLSRIHRIAAEQIHCAYDDRPDIVQMYKDLGLKAEVRSIHQVCAYNAPKE